VSIRCAIDKGIDCIINLLRGHNITRIVSRRKGEEKGEAKSDSLWGELRLIDAFEGWGLVVC